MQQLVEFIAVATLGAVLAAIALPIPSVGRPQLGNLTTLARH